MEGHIDRDRDEVLLVIVENDSCSVVIDWGNLEV